MKPTNYTGRGFTIVELLVVIVVIAILAAITIVSYNGITGRANDSVVQNNLNQVVNQINIDAVDRGSYIPGGATATGGTNTGNSTTIPGFTTKVSLSSLFATGRNFFYCQGNVAGVANFRIVARSKTGTAYSYDQNTGLTSLGSVALDQPTACSGFDSPYTWSYGILDGVPNSWTAG